MFLRPFPHGLLATRVVLLVAAVVCWLMSATLADSKPTPAAPVRVHAERFYPLLMPDGSNWGLSVKALAEGRLAVTAIVSKDSGQTWSERRTLVELPLVKPPQTVWGDVVPFVDRTTGDLHAFLLKWDQTDKKAPFPKLGLWHLQAPPPYRTWTTPTPLFDGYIGGLLSAAQHPNGTLIAPFAYMTTRSYSQKADGLMGWIFMGQHTTTSVYSTDRGGHFRRSSDVNIPASILLGNEAGAIEPVCLPLEDGRVWMLMRTQLGRMWESFSRDGITWGEPRPSRFIASDSPASLSRLSDGRIIVIWNCCQRYPYAFGGRQVLHAAISGDDGSTWDGFREVMRDPHRLEPALPIRGDYGTAYPTAAPTRDKKLMFAAGQGATGGVFLLDPKWLTHDEQQDDFSSGLEAWSVYGTKGARIDRHPARREASVLRLERTDAEFPAGAVWNFPNGRAGVVRIRFQALLGTAAAAITLTDHFSSPFDREGELNGLYTLSLAAGNSLSNGNSLQPGIWHDLELRWDFRKRVCQTVLDGAEWKVLPQLRLVSDGANYLRFRILSDKPSNGGLLIESVAAQVDLSIPSGGLDLPQ